MNYCKIVFQITLDGKTVKEYTTHKFKQDENMDYVKKVCCVCGYTDFKR